jgi:hypothetical protein
VGLYVPHHQIHGASGASDRLRARNLYLMTVIWYSLSTVTNLKPTDKFKYPQCILLAKQLAAVSFGQVIREAGALMCAVLRICRGTVRC